MNNSIIWLQNVDSTNNEALRRIDTLDNLSVISACCQTAGRGQKGNRWSSVPGENLTFSIVLKFADSPENACGEIKYIEAVNQFIINEITTLAVVNFLTAHGLEAKIKWSNDIYVGDRKICGILIENSVSGRHLSRSIIGIGINVNQREFPPELPNPTSMVREGCTPLSVESLLSEFMDCFKAAMTLTTARLREQYLGLMYRRGTAHQYRNLLTDETFTGTITGIDPIGRLVILPVDSTTPLIFGFKEIAFLIN